MLSLYKERPEPSFWTQNPIGFHAVLIQLSYCWLGLPILFQILTQMQQFFLRQCVKLSNDEWWDLVTRVEGKSSTLSGIYLKRQFLINGHCETGVVRMQEGQNAGCLHTLILLQIAHSFVSYSHFAAQMLPTATFIGDCISSIRDTRTRHRTPGTSEAERFASKQYLLGQRKRDPQLGRNKKAQELVSKKGGARTMSKFCHI